MKDGKWGFHTALEENPWWQVDLGDAMPLERIAIFNRCDHTVGRAVHVAVLLSCDGREFKQIYRHNGTVFYGQPDGKPLVVKWIRERMRLEFVERAASPQRLGANGLHHRQHVLHAVAELADEDLATCFCLDKFGDVFDGKQDQVRSMVAAGQLARVEQHVSPAELREIVLDREALEDFQNQFPVKHG